MTANIKKRTILATALVLSACVLPACKRPGPPASPTTAKDSEAQDSWLTDLGAAQVRAKAENKMVLVNFTGSDWCPPCKAFHKNVLTDKEFVDYATDNLVLVLVDFPESKPQSEEVKRLNKELAERFGIEGFPTVIVFSSDGRQLSKSAGYGGASAHDFVAELRKLKQ